MNQIFLTFFLLAAAASAEAANNVCPDSVGITLVPHPKDCSKFYFCVNGQANIYECPRGYEFSPSDNDCVEISDHGCTAIAHPGPPTTTTPAGPTMKPICQNPIGTLIVLEPHETDCTKFWACDPFGDDHMLLDCAEGLEFDIGLAYCVPIGPGGCTDKQNGTIDKPTDICANNFGINLFPDKDDCTIFHICSNADLVTLTCHSGFEFDKENKVCIPMTTGSCASNKKLEKSPVFNARKLVKDFYKRIL